MFTAKSIWDMLTETLGATGDFTRIAQIKRESRKAYYEQIGMTSWEAMRMQVSYNFDESEDGMWLPGDLAGIDCVANSDYEWDKAPESYAANRDITSRMWYYSEINWTPLLIGTDITIANGETAFTGGTGITAAMVGEYIRIGDQAGVYKLASVSSLETPFYGTDVDGVAFVVRPEGVKKIKLVAPDGETDTTAATIYYWRFPPQIYDDNQLVHLPSASLLELATLEKIYRIDRDSERANEAKKDLYGSKGRYEGELTRAISMNPEFISPIQPDNFLGKAAGWGAQR